MKKNISIILLFFSLKILFCQENKANFNYSNKEVAEFLSLNININYLNSNGYYFVDLPKGKDYKSRLSGEIIINDSSNIDIPSLDVIFSIDDYKYYLVTNLNLLLVIKSVRHIKNEMNLND